MVSAKITTYSNLLYIYINAIRHISILRIHIWKLTQNYYVSEQYDRDKPHLDMVAAVSLILGLRSRYVLVLVARRGGFVCVF